MDNGSLSEMMVIMASEARQYLSTGGVVAIPLTVLALILWFLIGLRVWILYWGPVKPPKGGMAGFLGWVTNRLDQVRTQAQGQEQLQVAPQVQVQRPGKGRDKGPCGQVLDPRLDLVFGEAEMVMGRYRKTIYVITAVAPLLGLLGTVSGMIETFDALTNMALFAQSGGVAGGISEALVSTQLGLFVAIPGVLVARLLDGREGRLRREVAQLRSLSHTFYDVLYDGSAAGP